MYPHFAHLVRYIYALLALIFVFDHFTVRFYAKIANSWRQIAITCDMLMAPNNAIPFPVGPSHPLFLLYSHLLRFYPPLLSTLMSVNQWAHLPLPLLPPASLVFSQVSVVHQYTIPDAFLRPTCTRLRSGLILLRVKFAFASSMLRLRYATSATSAAFSVNNCTSTTARD